MLKSALIGAAALAVSAPHTHEAQHYYRIKRDRMERIVRHLDQFDNRDGKYEVVGELWGPEGLEGEVRKPKKPSSTTLHDFDGWDKANPWFWVGNADTPEPPEWYDPNGSFRKFKWHVRNPGHNFTHYVIGLADKVDEPGFKRIGKNPKAVFAPEPGWNFAGVQYDGITYPYVSYWKKNEKTGKYTKFYLGWRPRTGNFGIKLNHTKEAP